MGGEGIRETVLIIEDSFEVREFLCDVVLAPGHYHVSMAIDGQEGLERALAQKPDLILLDLELPRLHGLGLLRHLQERGLHIPTIVLTAHSSEETILQSFRLGARDFLRKPFEVYEARAAIEMALAEERLRREKETLTRALALANRRLQHQSRNWIALHSIAQAITSTLEESEVYRLVMANVNRILQVEAGSLLLLNPQTGFLEFKMTLHGDAAQLSKTYLKVGQGIAGWVAQHGQPLLVPDVRKDPRFYPRIDQTSGFRTRSVLCVPLKSKGQIIGVLEVINKLRGPESPSFTKGDLELLTMLASWVSVAVENARFSQEMRKVVAMKTLKQVVITVAHHINNRLMNLSLEMDYLEQEGKNLDGEKLETVVASARRWIKEIAGIVKALDRIEEIHLVLYVGVEEMLDLDMEHLEDKAARTSELAIVVNDV